MSWSALRVVRSRYYPAMEVGRDPRSGVGPRNQRTPLPAGLYGRGEEYIGVRDLTSFHDPEFWPLVLAARAVIAERVHRGVATPPEPLAVAALDEMPDEDHPAAVRAWGAVGRVPGCGSLGGAHNAGALRRHRRGAGGRSRPGGRRRRRDDALTTPAGFQHTGGGRASHCPSSVHRGSSLRRVRRPRGVSGPATTRRGRCGAAAVGEREGRWVGARMD